MKAVISQGKITDIQFLQYPSDRSRSVRINSYADPVLRSEALQAQSAQVDVVSGATDSSEAFIQSLDGRAVAGKILSRGGMKQFRLLMGMPITVEILDPDVSVEALDGVFTYLRYVDETFSTYKSTSEISRINRGEIRPRHFSNDVRTILELSEQTKRETRGYFNIARGDYLDPSGIVKGWAIQQAAEQLRVDGWKNFYIEAGGDIQVSGLKEGRPWRIGIRNPFVRDEYVKVLSLTNQGIATSGTAVRGQHIYDPFRPGEPLEEVMSLTVIGPDVYEADRFATAAFAMGAQGISFIESLPDFEGYLIDAGARATFTSGFERYVVQA